MILINCPYCGERDQTEFSNGGEAHVARPENSENLNDKDWGRYVFYRDNPKGIFYERWVHTHGCRKWFNAVRNTSTDEILKIYKLNEKINLIGNFSYKILVGQSAKSPVVFKKDNITAVFTVSYTY